MSKTLQSITDKSIVNDLVKAYADEWLAYYLYSFMASVVSGELYPQLKDMLEEIAKEEYTHSEEIADLIVKLGGKPIADPMSLEDMANNPVVIPSDDLDLNSVCEAVAQSESGAIKVYNELALKTKDKDIVVFTKVQEILSEEVSHEEMFENLRAK